MHANARKILIILAVVVVGGIWLGSKSLRSKLGTRFGSRRSAGPQATKNPDREPGHRGLPLCFVLETLSAATKPDFTDCLLLVPGQNEVEAFEVNLRNGLFLLAKTDLSLLGTPPIVFTRTFRASSNWSTVWEIPAAHVYNIYPTGSRYPYTYIDLNLADGESLQYVRISPGTGYADAVYEHTSTYTALYGSQIKWNGNGWDLTLSDGTVYFFPEAYNATRPAQGALVGIRDRTGNALRLTRNPAGNLLKVISPDGRWLELDYAGNSITQLKDSLGRIVSYEYDTRGRLWKVTEPNGGATEYAYDDSNRLLTVKSSAGTIVLKNEYDARGRITRQILAGRNSYRFKYTTDAHGNTIRTDVNDARGTLASITFSGSSFSLTTRAQSQ